MGYAVRERICAGCGGTIKGRLPPKKPVRCIECAIKYALHAARDMANHDGEFYDRWLKTRGPLGRPRKN